MDSAHNQALYVSYYLARFDKIAYQKLGFGNKSNTHKKIAEILNVKSLTLRNWRDEFDPFFENRAGWHQVEPRLAVKDVMNYLNEFEEEKVRNIVLDILGHRYNREQIQNTKALTEGKISNANELAIIIAFYLSKFDKLALKNLGFKNDSDAFTSIADILGIKKNYLKFRRDEFDPIHPWRKGWQRPMDSRIIKSIEALQDLEEPDLRTIVLGILYDEHYRKSEDVEQITNLFSEKKKEKIAIGKFVLRAPTGKAAEEFFLNHFSENKNPIDGKLIDCRDFGVGYDFRIEINDKKYFVEVKGLSEFLGGVLFTSKEWIVAKDEGDKYFLCVVSNLSEHPRIIFIQDPFEKLNPTRNIYTTIQISWSVTQNQLAELFNGI